ncbi:ribonuclease TUDOR 1-like [Actinidia eriantha]|uniref:ribonuclease TUDOR 1-like n=1 Tax=Actinidia eriantha TaxID=165200 RepID=UPI00258B87C1|nr:ribonuclease TUDOR 1-like [Actinidia eriantha]
MGVNIAELLIACGFGTIIRHRDFEERSNYYDAVLSAESCAIAEKKGIHSSKDSPAMHIADLTTAPAKKTKYFLPFLQQKRLPAIVEYVLSGHRFKLFVPKGTCSFAFSFSGVRCPDCDEPLSDEAIAFMRRKIMQRKVEIEVKMLIELELSWGSMWESKSNMAVTLLEAGLAKLQTSFGPDRIPDAHISVIRGVNLSLLDTVIFFCEKCVGSLLVTETYHFIYFRNLICVPYCKPNMLQ